MNLGLRQVVKKRGELKKLHTIFVVFSLKIEPKSSRKTEKNHKSREIDKKPSPVTQFSAKVAFQVDFWTSEGSQNGV